MQSLTFVAWPASLDMPTFRRQTVTIVAGRRLLSIENECDHVALSLYVAGGVNGEAETNVTRHTDTRLKHWVDFLSL